MPNTKTPAEKMGIEGVVAFLQNGTGYPAPDLQLPAVKLKQRLTGQFDYLHLFVRTQTEFIREFPKMQKHLATGGRLWVSWPKARQLDTDLTLPVVIKIGYDFGLVESTTLSLDGTWSAIKFTHPKVGKVYQNSYGKLPGHAF